MGIFGEVTHLKHRYRGRRRRTRRGTWVLLMVLCTVFLVSCVAGSNPLWIRGLFGIDVANYAAESAEQVLATDSDTAARLCDMVDILTVGSADIHGFRTPSQAVKYHRDAILNDMLRDNFTLYNGNTASLSAVQQAYPHRVITSLIPASDFENAVSRYFGGTGISHKNGNAFEYLSRADAYTSPVQVWDPFVGIRVTSLEETLHTYRMAFDLYTDAESISYFAIFVKRDDGSCYFYSLEQL